MATRIRINQNVYQAALDRLIPLYAAGHRMVVAFSAGKDSNVCLDLAIDAARQTNRLPVDVIMRDEEIMFPGTFEYAERVYRRPEVAFKWIYACQPIINVFDREHPYWWVFDPQLPPETWVRQPPAWAERIYNLDIQHMVIPERFPPAAGKKLFVILGLRTAESRARMMGLFSSKGYITGENRFGVAEVRPIYDWSAGDVWKAISENHWDYNEAYDVMARFGFKGEQCRIAPPSMSIHGAALLQMSQKAWPRWFDRVCDRLPGLRAVAKFGVQAVSPRRMLHETWEQAFQRTCIDEAPAWVRARAEEVRRKALSAHRAHSSAPYPDVTPCHSCAGHGGSWAILTRNLYHGDPFSQKHHELPYVEPEQFRAGAGTWDGKPAF